MAAAGSSLFQIRRIFSVHEGPAPAPGASSSASEWPARAQIEAMAVHTLEKKQLLALSLSPAAADGPSASTTAKTAGKTTDQTVGNLLLLRTIEEDRRARFWRVPVCSSLKQQRAGRSERLGALAFSPEGDWLAALSSRKNRFHLVPVLALIARQRTALLDATYRPAHNRELLSVRQSVMNVQMAAYLRATNEAGGLNGARYHSQVAGDDEQMSTLEFAVGMGNVTCLRWWRSFNGKNYCLVGGSESLVSIVNVEENAEECRCELANAGVIESIDLLRENFRRENRTSMLVKARGEDALVRYYRVVLEKKFQPPTTAPTQKNRPGKKRGEDAGREASGDSDKTAGNKGISAFALFAGAVNVAARIGARAPKFVVKTFPEHFLQDLDFRPQRIKKNLPHVQLFAINGLLSSESSLALYDCKQQKVNLYSNFHWSLKGVYDVPSLLSEGNEDANDDEGEAPETVEGSVDEEATSVQGRHDKEEDVQQDGVTDIELTYCSSDLMLLQGKHPDSGTAISTWVSLPSHQSLDDSVATAHIVHYLSLHNNEKVERVVQSTARNIGSAAGAGASVGGGRGSTPASSNDSEVIYILQTRHNVYECRPQWSRVALFRALCAQSIALSNALSIGYALGIDMASLCQVAANTLYNNIVQEKASADATLLSWIRDLFEVSRVLPSTAIRQLTGVGGTAYAIEYAKHILKKAPRGPDYDESERSRVAYLLIDLLLQPRLYIDGDINGAESVSVDQDDFDTEDPDRAENKHQEWLMHFLETNRDYDTSEVVELCLEHQRVEITITVGIQRHDVSAVLEKIVAAGLAQFVSTESVDQLLEVGQGAALAAPESRLILHALPLEVQVAVLLSHPPSILQHRDWVARNMAAIPVELCRRLASAIDPRMKTIVSKEDDAEGSENGDTDDDETIVSDTNHSLLADAVARSESPAVAVRLAGVTASEFIRPSPEEQVELFLTALLRLNMRDDDDKPVIDDSDEYSQSAVESLMKELADRYRPPIVIARCVDYGNWSAAACIYEAHGELVEALECRLNAKRALRAVPPLSPPSSPTKPQSGPHSRRHRQFSIESDSLGSEEAEHQDEMRQELLELLNSLVVQRHKQSEDSEKISSQQLRAAILARLLVKWVESGLGRAELEVFLVSPSVYPHVSSLLAAIFFSDVVAAVSGNGLVHGDGGADGAKPVTHFDDRDREWIDKCHALAFSGQFLFRVCMSFLEHSTAERSGGSAPLPTAINPQDSSATLSPTLSLLDLVKENIVSNDLAHVAVRIGPHSAQSLGKSDPLETHVKVFTCGHVFPKRLFEDEVVPEFEKRMNALPLPLLATKHLFTREFRRSVVEAPCPVCSFNRISEAVYERLATGVLDGSGARSPTKRRTNAGLYFLHQSASDRAVYSASSNMAGATHARRHERWEWREPKTDFASRNAAKKANTTRPATTKAP
jgi:hypothetical protein